MNTQVQLYFYEHFRKNAANGFCSKKSSRLTVTVDASPSTSMSPTTERIALLNPETKPRKCEHQRRVDDIILKESKSI